MMQAGLLDRRVTLQQATYAQDGAGTPVPTWATVAEVWGRVEPMTVREPFQAEQEAAWVDTKVTIRHRSDVGPKWRITHGGRTYDILGVRELGRREGLEILASARAE